MPAINLKKAYYDELIRLGLKPTQVVDDLVTKYFEEIKSIRWLQEEVNNNE